MRIAPGRVTLGLLGFLSLSGLFILLASIPGESADPADNGAQAAADELRVTFALPSGPVETVPSVDVLWNRPMRPLGKDTRGDEPSLLQLAPPIAGRRLWIGSRALRFVPDRPLPRATRFTGRVPAQVADAQGKRLQAPFEWTFSTLAPAVVHVSPAPGVRYLDPAGPIAVIFNQPIDRSKLAQALRLIAGKTAVRASLAAADTAALARLQVSLAPGTELSAIVLVSPSEPLPPATELGLEIPAADIAAEGSLPMAKPYEVKYRTRGPLELLSAEATAQSLSLNFSNPVDPDSVLAVLQLSGPARRSNAPPPVAHGGGNLTPSVYFGAQLLAGKALTMTVGPGLRDQFGQTLGREERRELVTQDLMPELRILPENATLEARGAKRTALVQGLNLTHVTVRAAAIPVDRAAALLRQPWMIGADGDPFKGLRPVQRTHTLPDERNKRHSIPLDLNAFLGDGAEAGGCVLVRASSPDRIRHPAFARDDTLRPAYSVVQVTDLGLVAKVSAADLLIWATSLHTGEPLAGVELRITNQAGSTVWKGETGADGLVRSRTPAPWETARGWTLFGKRGRDQALLLLDQDWELSPWSFNVPGDFARHPVRSDAFLFSDRELYRPGDRVHVKGILRGRGREGLAAAPIDSARLIVSGPNGDEVLRRSLTVSEFGTVMTDFALPAGAPLGYYWGRIEPTADRSAVDLRGSLSFRIEAYRAAPFQVALELAGPDTTGGARRLVRGDKLGITARARTFYDAPIAGAQAALVIRREQAWGPPPVPAGADEDLFARYTFQDLTIEESPWGLVTTESARLNDRGEVQLRTTVALDEVETPQTLEVEMNVRDAGDRSVAATRRIDWFPAAIRLGIAAEPQVVAAGSPVRVEVVTTELAGKAKAGVPVTVHWIERRWHTVMRPMAGGRLGYESEFVDTVLDSAVVTTVADLAHPIAAEFTPRAPGAYLVRATGRDSSGRVTKSADFFYVAGAGYVPWSRDAGPKLTLIADQAAYSPGDTATILVQSPYPTARGLLTVEREGIHVAIPFQAQSSAPTLKIPLGQEAVPNLFASVVLVRGAGPGAGSAPDDTLWSGTPEVAIGYANLVVKPDARKLALKIAPPASAGPGDSVRVRVAVTSAESGAPAEAEVALFLVDEAVLHLLGTPTPDPFAFFYRTQGLGVVNAAKALHVVEAPAEAEKGGAPGGGGGDGGRFRRLFAATAAFIPDLRTGPDGTAEAGIRLPDNLTTFRVMAVACDRRDRMGSGDAPLVVTRPLVLDPIVPRVARAGDAFEVGAVLANRTTKSMKVRAELGLKDGALATEDKTTADVTIPAGQSRRVRFPVVARAAGAPEVRLSAAVRDGKSKAAVRDAVAFPLTIVEPTIAVTDAHYGRLMAPDSLAIVPVAFDPTSDPRLSALELELSTSAVGGLEDAIQYLLDYPHDCLEQLDSRLIGLAMAKEFAYELILPGWPPERLTNAAAATVAEISALANYDGGYRLWPSLPQAAPYLSAYTLLALLEARAQGVTVSDDQLQQLGGYLKRQIDSKRLADSRGGKAVPAEARQARSGVTSIPFSTGDALAAMLLAHENRRKGSPLSGLLTTADLDRMHRHLADFDASGKLFLASALNEALRTDPRVGALLTAALNDVSLAAGSAFVAPAEERFGSDESLSAIALRTMIATWPDHELVPGLARWLGERRGRGHWRNTHATAFALLAERDLARREGRSDPRPVAARAAIGQSVLLDQSLGGTQPVASRVTWPLAKLRGVVPGTPAELQVRRSVAGGGAEPNPKPLHHAIRLVSARPALTSGALEAGLILIRTPHAFDPNRPEVAGEVLSRARAGDPVRIELTVIVPRAATDVVLEDPLPAGLEPIVLDFQTTARSLGLALEAREMALWNQAEDGGEGGEWEGEGSSDTPPPGAASAPAPAAGVFPAVEVERHDDRVVAYAPRVPAGIHRFEYLARAATPGKFQAPPARVELMYDPEVHGTTAPLAFEVLRGEE